jgi:hypothetical protein
MTEQERVAQIARLVKEAEKHPPGKQLPVEVIAIGGQDVRCYVIPFQADEVLLNPSSHRLRAQLVSDPEWPDLSGDPFGAQAQKLLERHVREARSPEQFQALKDSLLRDGQEYPGVMTHKGVLINANTRAVALRDLDDPNRRYIKAAVLPDTVRDEELALLELRLQMQKDLKEPYSLTNELLFIEEMYKRYRVPPAQIAERLRLGSGKKGEREINLRLNLLGFIRELQKVPSRPLKLTFFDEIKLQHLKDLYAKYEPLVNTSPGAARRLAENWLLSVAVGLTAVHKLRHVDEAFDTEYLLPTLKQEEGPIGDFAEEIAASPADPAPTRSGGVGALLGGSGGTAEPSIAGNLLNILVAKDNWVKVTSPGAKNSLTFDARDVRDAVQAATFGGVKAKQADDRNDNKLDAPLAAVKSASASLDQVITALTRVRDDPEFDKPRRDKLVHAWKKHRKAVKNIEAAFGKFGLE